MTSREKKKKQVRELYRRQNGLCCWCGREMLHPDQFTHTKGARTPSNLCTLEHLDDRFDPQRGKHTHQFRRFAACSDCNNLRSQMRQAALPIEELWERSTRHRRPPAVERVSARPEVVLSSGTDDT